MAQKNTSVQFNSSMSDTKKLEGQEFFTKEQIIKFVIKLKKQHFEIQKKQFFCSDHNFNLEAKAKENEGEVVRKICHQMEDEFDLGFVWDESLNN